MPVTATWLDEADLPAWDAFVASHPLGTIYQTSAWRRVLQESFPHIRGRILAIRDPETGRFLAGTAIYLVRSWLLGRRLVSVPFASRVSPLVSTPEHTATIMDRCADHRRLLKASSVELRFASESELLPKSQEIRVDRSNLEHRIRLQRDTDAIFRKIARTALRQPIQKAAASGIVVEDRNDDTAWDRFYQLHAESRRRLSLPVMPRRFFRNLRQHLQASHLRLLLARRDEHMLGAGLALVHGGLYLLEWAGDSPLGRKLGANKLLYWEAIQDACRLNCHTFSLGRTDEQNESLRTYKRHWGTDEIPMPVLEWPADAGENSQTKTGSGAQLRHFGEAILPRCPKWMYAQFSAFCYRHLG